MIKILGPRLPFPKKNLQKSLEDFISGMDFKTGPIFYYLVNDDDLLEINKRFLNHYDLTDIITFDYSDKEILSGEIFISLERVKDNATKLKIPFEEELLRVMAHGILHLMGLKDNTKIEKKRMRREEEKAIRFLLENVSRGTKS
ncbi:MAG: rRNA maturation RNase YbeY [Flavobacteriales bacterium]|nr:rRNA maturation RNase YbeY [Flavobacteriales bacterium]